MQPIIYHFEEHNLNLSSVDPNALLVIKNLRKSGHKAYLVGGCIRDLLLKEKPKDFDISTSARPEEIKSCFRNCILIGRRFRLAHIRFGQYFIEVSTFRAGDPEQTDLIIKDNLWGTPEEDVLRRDFTINGLFYDPEENVIIDYTGGVQDIKNRFLQTIGNPVLRFKQDPVRMIRLLKILSRYDFEVESNTQAALVSCTDEILKSSRARVFEEIIKVLSSSSSHKFFRLIQGTQFLNILFSSMAESFESHSRIKDMTLEFLKALDSMENQDKFNVDRGFLLAALAFSTVDFHLRAQKKEQKKISQGFILEFLREHLNNFFTNSFTGCSRKNFINALLILQAQYKMTPLNPKYLKVNTKLSKQPYFSSALKLLALRSMVNPKLKAKYSLWVNAMHNS